MSEEILKALTRLFAILTKQDVGATEVERAFVHQFFRQEVDQSTVDTYLKLFDEWSGYNARREGENLVSVQDTVRTLSVCKKINRTLTQRQKVVVLVRLLELMASDRQFTAKRMELFETIATIFHIDKEELELLKALVMATTAAEMDLHDVLLAGEVECLRAQKLTGQLTGFLAVVSIKSVGSCFVRYFGQEKVLLNGQPMVAGRVYTITHGGSVKSPSGAAWYFSDLIAAFNREILKEVHLCFHAQVDEFRFDDGKIGLRNVTIAEGPGRLVGIMGASGAGKTTLLNVLTGISKPTVGSVVINGFDLHSRPEELKGVVGFVAQDDLLIEELTVFQNLYFNARLCFAGLTEKEITEKVMAVLTNLGLDHLRDLRVGTILDKMISGGQRKRLNIALELIREPSVLFLDEPTSGLSSRDSEHVIDLLKELSLKGKLVIVVIHQPSSEIFKVFDKMLILDAGGYPAYYGPPVEAVEWFRRQASQVDANQGQCDACGNVNPEQIFNLLEAEVVDEYGRLSARRKVNPAEWHRKYLKSVRPNLPMPEKVTVPPESNLRLPNRLQQAWIFLSRDFLAKISNRQYLLINLLEAPLLALILSWIIRYPNLEKDTRYVFRFNDNIPAYFLMAVVVSLFIGLSVSAEEIIRDRKILRRESFLNLSRSSYLLSKLMLLFGLSAIQMLAFVWIGNKVLGINDMGWSFWLILFSASCFANVLGLNISSAFNSAVTVYILIPLLLIPQMVLSGVLFSFDQLHPVVTQKGKVPVVADLMASRWAYEAMTVVQVRENAYNRPLVAYEERKAEADYKMRWLSEAMRSKVDIAQRYANNPVDSLYRAADDALSAVRHAVSFEKYREGLDTALVGALRAPQFFTADAATRFLSYLDRYESHYQDEYNSASSLLERKVEFLSAKYQQDMNVLLNENVNQELTDLARNIKTREPVADLGNQLTRQATPIYMEVHPDGTLDYRAPFFAPQKNFLGFLIPTFWFNIGILWLMSGLLYLALYGEWLARLVQRADKSGIRLGRWDSKAKS